MAVFTVARWTYPSKKVLLAHLQALLHGTPEDTLLVGDDAELLHALILRHPKAEEKIGGGVKGFVVGRDTFGGRQFRVARYDGTQEPFAYRKTVTRPNPQQEHRQRVNNAFRQEVSDQTQAVKHAAVGSMCPLSSARLVLSTTDVDHIGPPFIELVGLFLAQEGLVRSSILLTENKEGDRLFLADRPVADRWREFHRAKAELQAIHRDAHRSKDGATIKPLDQTYLRGSVRMQAGEEE